MATDGLSILEAFQNDCIEPLLVLQDMDSAVFKGLDNCNVPPEQALVVELLDYPINECSEEISLTELDDPDGSLRCLCTSQPQMHGHCFL